LQLLSSVFPDSKLDLAVSPNSLRKVRKKLSGYQQQHVRLQTIPCNQLNQFKLLGVEVSIVDHHQHGVIETLLTFDNLLHGIQAGMPAPNPDQSKAGIADQLPRQGGLSRAGYTKHEAVATASQKWILQNLTI
jgi:hypothetical protein